MAAESFGCSTSEKVFAFCLTTPQSERKSTKTNVEAMKERERARQRSRCVRELVNHGDFSTETTR